MRLFCYSTNVTTPTGQIGGLLGQVPYEFRPNFEQSFLAYEVYEQATRAFEIIISLDLF